MTRAARSFQPDAITGIQALAGEHGRAARGFWTDAWAQILKRPSAVVALVWVAVVSGIAVFAPLIANGHPVVAWDVFADGSLGPAQFPLFAHLTAVDIILACGSALALMGLLIPGPASRAQRLGMILAGSAQAGVIVAVSAVINGFFSHRDASDWARALEQRSAFIPVAVVAIAAICSAPFLLLPAVKSRAGRLLLALAVAGLTGGAVWKTWKPAPEIFDYADRQRAGQLEAVYTLVPWSPDERVADRDAKFLPPGTSVDQPLAKILISGLPITGALSAEQIAIARSRIAELPLPPAQQERLASEFDALISSAGQVDREAVRRLAFHDLAGSGRVFYLGTDLFGQDVLSQLLHACRLAVSIGLVSTGIATLIGVTIGALMGYFGGMVDLLLYRVVEIFMAIPLLFILIVAAGVLPADYRNTYVMMAIIGCFTWTGAARYTRAEFYKLRNQDFVQSARAVGLPLRSILFRHMLPNGVTPVLVDASFAIAFAIILEATLSFLGLGPADQASWGRLLADATGPVGDFNWWLAIFPGLAIFLAALSYNLIGEALRDAIDPKLKKARV
jgi:ABC-type dipeptide/oligopeptide/nickel transport system permease subunit